MQHKQHHKPKELKQKDSFTFTPKEWIKYKTIAEKYDFMSTKFLTVNEVLLSGDELLRLVKKLHH